MSDILEPVHTEKPVISAKRRDQLVQEMVSDGLPEEMKEEIREAETVNALMAEDGYAPFGISKDDIKADAQERTTPMKIYSMNETRQSKGGD